MEMIAQGKVLVVLLTPNGLVAYVIWRNVATCLTRQRSAVGSTAPEETEHEQA